MLFNTRPTYKGTPGAYIRFESLIDEQILATISLWVKEENTKKHQDETPAGLLRLYTLLQAIQKLLYCQCGIFSTNSPQTLWEGPWVKVDFGSRSSLVSYFASVMCLGRMSVNHLTWCCCLSLLLLHIYAIFLTKQHARICGPITCRFLDCSMQMKFYILQLLWKVAEWICENEHI